MKQTSGGRFDPTDPFLYFLAGDTDEVEHDYPYTLFAINELVSGRMEEFKRVTDDEDTRVLLDSGIFNLANGHARRHGMSMDEALSMAPEDIDGFNSLWDAYGDIVTTYADRLWGVIELDQGGKNHKPITRARIEREFGITPMPVFHPLLDGWDYYDSITAEYDRICVGNIVQAAPPVRMRLLHSLYEHAHEHLNTWHHLLGYTPNDMLYALPIHGSADSSTWLSGIRWMPTWAAKTAAKPISNYPSVMWYDNANPDATHAKAASVLYWNALSLGYGASDWMGTTA